jgi:hypothetical protein
LTAQIRSLFTSTCSTRLTVFIPTPTSTGFANSNVSREGKGKYLGADPCNGGLGASIARIQHQGATVMLERMLLVAGRFKESCHTELQT